MEMTQIYQIVNETTAQVTGTEPVADIDANKIVDAGAEVLDTDQVDHYVKSLIDRIGKVVFVNRPYTGGTPSVMMDSWEYGAILEKIQYEGLPEAEENDTWNLEDRRSYDPNVFYKPTVSAKFFSERRTFDIPMSFAQRQVKTAFQSAGQLQAFFAMIESAISNGMTAKMDSLVEATINNFIVTSYGDGTGNARVVKLLTEYNTFTGKTAPAAAVALSDPEFIRFCAFVMKRKAVQMQKLSTVFNAGGKYRHTPSDRLHMILHADFAAAADAYLQSDTYHNEFVSLPNSDQVAFWQGSGTRFAWADTSKIIITPRGTDSPVTLGNVVGVMFDRDALGVSNLDRRVTTNWNAKGEFTNNWYKFDAGYFNDFNENGVIFILA
jgi:hypothetical protein